MNTIKVTHDTVVNQIIRERVSTRGGGVEISLTKFGFRGEKMAAYQNYLGGGMLGRVMVNDTIRTGSVTKQLMYSSEFERLDQIGEILKLSESATKSLLFRAYQTLRERLKEFI